MNETPSPRQENVPQQPWTPQPTVSSVVAGILRRIRPLGFVLYGALVALLVGVGLFSGVAELAAAREPLSWGTYAHEYCTEGRYSGCRSHGTWVSDDGTRILHDVRLEGWPDDNGTVRAALAEVEVLVEPENPVVRTEFWVVAAPFAPWLVCVIFVVFFVVHLAEYRSTRAQERSARRRPERRPRLTT